MTGSWHLGTVALVQETVAFLERLAEAEAGLARAQEWMDNATCGMCGTEVTMGPGSIHERLAEAEADADRLARQLRKVADLFTSDHEALRLHDAAVARRSEP